MPSGQEEAAPNPGKPPKPAFTTLEFKVWVEDGVTTIRVVVRCKLGDTLIERPEGDTHPSGKLLVWHEEQDGKYVTVIEATGERAEVPAQYLQQHGGDFYSGVLAFVLDLAREEVTREPEKYEAGIIQSTHTAPGSSDVAAVLTELIQNIRNLHH